MCNNLTKCLQQYKRILLKMSINEMYCNLIFTVVQNTCKHIQEQLQLQQSRSTTAALKLTVTCAKTKLTGCLGNKRQKSHIL